MDIYGRITINGDLGSGKSHVGRLLADVLGIPYYSTGQLQRQMAAQRGMTTLELNRYAEAHKGIDDEIDSLAQKIGEQHHKFVLDARLGWHFIPQSFKIYLAVQTDIAARRVFGDSTRAKERYTSVAVAKEAIKLRQESERKRFKQIYGIDLWAANHYQLIIDTSYAPPEAIKVCILDHLQCLAAAEEKLLPPKLPLNTPKIAAQADERTKNVHLKELYVALPHLVAQELAKNDLFVMRDVHAMYSEFATIYRKYTLDAPPRLQTAVAAEALAGTEFSALATTLCRSLAPPAPTHSHSST